MGHQRGQRAAEAQGTGAGRLNDTESAAAASLTLALTSGQRRAIGAFLHQVAHAIERFESLTGEQLGKRLDYVEVVDNLSAAERASARQYAEALVREANALAALCHIPREVASARAALDAEFSVLWATAEDTAPQRLVGYGPVAPDVARLLAPAIARMTRLSFALAHLDALTDEDDAPPPRDL